MSMSYPEIISFHGHSCPGLAMGYRMAVAALEFLQEVHSEDEEVVAIAENDACGVDALQCVTGCTFGKGNLIFRDYGKQVYTLFSRRTGGGVRVHFHGRDIPQDLRQSREALSEWILHAPAEKILSLRKVEIKEPEKAEIRESLVCAFCGEQVMENRTRVVNGKTSCVPCALDIPAHRTGFCSPARKF